MTTKLIVFLCFSVIAGIGFVAVGIYFLSQAFLNKLNASAPDKSAEGKKKNEFRAKGCGFVSISLGALTLVWGLFVFMFPSLAPVLSLIYMLSLVAAFSVIVFVFR